MISRIFTLYMFLFLCLSSYVFGVNSEKYSMRYSLTPVNPKLTIIFVTDSVPKASIDMVQNFLNGGVNFLRNNGVNYLNVFHPYANCSSSQGFAGFTTGTFPSSNGIVNNSWIDVDGVSFKGAAQDNVLEGSAVYDPTNGKRYWLDPGETPAENPSIGFTYGRGPFVAPTFMPSGTGISPKNMVVDNLSDQLMIFKTNELNTEVYSIAMDPTTPTIMAGRLGKALWMDPVSGLFTSSQYYFPDGLPEWVNRFNEQHPIPKTIVWNPLHPIGSPAYQFPDAQNYSGSALPLLSAFTGVDLPSGSLFGQTLPSILPDFGAQVYIFSPTGIDSLFKFVERSIDVLLNDDPNSRLVLWVNFFSFDIISYLLGTQIQESIDSLYQMDLRMGELIKFVEKKLPLSDALFVMCNDEAKYPNIPEILQGKNFDLARRTQTGFPITSPPPFNQKPTDLVARLNTYLVANLPAALQEPWVYAIEPPFIYMNAPNPDLMTGLPNFFTLTPSEQNTVTDEVIKFMLLQPGIKDAWSFSTLKSFPFEKEDLGRFYKLNLFQDPPPTDLGMATQDTSRRSGEVIFQSTPYNYVTSGCPASPFPTKGIDHTSPYNYDSHSTLYIFQAGRFANKIITEPVLIHQLPITLSEILQVPRPSGTTADLPPLPLINPNTK